METHHQPSNNYKTTLTKQQPKTKIPPPTKLWLILVNVILLTVGQIAGPILSRMYFIHGGQKRWLSAWTVTAGFPVLILPISFSYYQSRNGGRANPGSISLPKSEMKPAFFLSRRLAAASAVLGLLLGVNSYLYSFGNAYLPVSVSSLVSSSQLAFTAVFAFLIVRQRFTHYSINAIVLMTLGSVILGFHMDKDVPRGESVGKYVLGFFMTVGAATVHGLFMTMVEYTQGKAGVRMTLDFAMQFQFIVSMFATLFCTVPMIINGDFETLSQEAAEFGLGERKYYLIVILAVIALQVMIIGGLGTILTTSSLFAGIITALLVPVQQAFAVFTLHEGFNAEKGMALALCLWGFASHLYGGYKVSLEKDGHNPTQSNGTTKDDGQAAESNGEDDDGDKHVDSHV